MSAEEGSRSLADELRGAAEITMIEAEMMFILNHFESFVLIDLMEALATRDTEVERLQHEMERLAANSSSWISSNGH